LNSINDISMMSIWIYYLPGIDNANGRITNRIAKT